MSGRGSNAVQCLVVQSVDLGCLEEVPIRRSIPAFCVLECSGLFGVKAAKRMMGREPVPYHASRGQRVRWEGDRRIKALALMRASGGGRCPCA